MSRYQKGKTNLDFTGARDSEWQWHQLGYMRVCTSLQIDNYASTLPRNKFFYRPDALPGAQDSVKALKAYDINKQTIYVVPKSKIESRAHYTPEPAWGEVNS